MKKFLFSIIIFLGLTMLWYQSASAESDTTAPYINSFKILTPKINAGGTASFQLDVTETETGISQIRLIFQDSDGSGPNGLEITKDFAEPIYSGKVTVSLSGIQERRNYIQCIYIYDYAGNIRCYAYKYNIDDYHLADDDLNVCNLENGAYFDCGDPVTFPEIVSLNVTTTSVKKGGSLKFTMEMRNGIPKKKYIMYFGLHDKLFGCASTETYTFTYSTTISGSITMPYASIGNYSVEEIYLKPADSSYYKRYINKSTGSSLEAFAFDNIGNQSIKVLSNKGITSPPPKLTGISFYNDKATIPGVIKGKVSATASGGIQWIEVYFSEKDTYTSLEADVKKDGSFSLKIPTTCPAGDYYVSLIKIYDLDDNFSRYEGVYIDSDGKPYMTYIDPYTGATSNVYVFGSRTNPYILVKEEFDVAFERSLNNPTLLDDINNMDEDKTAKIIITSPYIAKKELFEAIQGKNKTLVFYTKNYQWVFKGTNITSPKDINLNTTFTYSSNGDEYNSDTGILKIDFPANGVLPGKANIRIKSDYTKAIYKIKKNLYLYYVSPDGNNLEYQNDSNINYYLDGRDSWVSFYITHNSKFVASGNKISDMKLGVKKGIKFKSKKYKCTFITLGGRKVAVLKTNTKSVKTVTIPKKITVYITKSDYATLRSLLKKRGFNSGTKFKKMK